MHNTWKYFAVAVLVLLTTANLSVGSHTHTYWPAGATLIRAERDLYSSFHWTASPDHVHICTNDTACTTWIDAANDWYIVLMNDVSSIIRHQSFSDCFARQYDFINNLEHPPWDIMLLSHVNDHGFMSPFVKAGGKYHATCKIPRECLCAVMFATQVPGVGYVALRARKTKPPSVGDEIAYWL